MDQAQLKALQEMLKRRTVANTASPQLAREWILRDGVHRRDGALLNQGPARQRTNTDRE